ncbi:MAG: InlB B-repeat-containing protein, partial [Bacilli bacterium]|nr:InlB B-repeat-containing protein [Bacilli bacterium]
TPPVQELAIDPKGLLQVDYYYYRNSYDIYYFTNGGEAMQSERLKFGAYLDVPDAERDGFTFGGWYLDMELTQSLNLITMPGHQVYLYAYYTEELKPTSLNYQMIDDNEENPQEYFMITSFNGELPSSVVLPSYIGDIPILSIGDNAFIDATIIEIKLPEDLIFMGKDVFNQLNLIVYLKQNAASLTWLNWCDETTILYYL